LNNKVEDWQIVDNGEYSYGVTVATAKINGVTRQISLNWIKNTLTISASHPRDWDFPLDARTFPLPNYDIVKFIEEVKL